MQTSMMPRRHKFAPHLVTISETATIFVSKEKKSCIAELETGSISTRSNDARITRSNSAPPDAEAINRRLPMLMSARNRSHSAECLLRATTKTCTTTTAETRAPFFNIIDDCSQKLDKTNKYGRSKLHNAVRKGDKQAITHLLATEPELLHQADKRGNHPLHYAASPNVPNGVAVACLLLKAGASVNAMNNRQQTPLFIAVISNNTDDDTIPRLLLFHHAKPMIKVTNDLMLAHYASSRGHYKVAATIREYI
ncbi:unnamed protein product [Peronospora belbahrii]|uniref:Uncharacterized protein n=1 Tax=Peronospora belbahrii TaxID=622444 RepID=A0AAU9KQM9_9STRA|nr:unnamed protein product [Peronospora belbahrii]CAH0520534.1 unnamed protein product [Peronospora belbahrii]